MPRVRLSLLLVALSALVACTSGPPPPDDGPYLTQIQQTRADNNAFFRSSDGPLTPEGRATFKGLLYYPIDPLYRVPARLEVKSVDRSTVLELPQSHTTEKRKMQRIGVLHFSLPSISAGELTLTAFNEVDAPDLNRLFVPFTDATSNTETYGGGRYL